MFISSRTEIPEKLQELRHSLYNHDATESKQVRFDSLLQSLVGYYPSERCHGKTCVIGGQCGNLDAKVMFIAEAPGRNGAERTGIPLYGDPTGDNFERILDASGLNRKDVFITNTFLWNPTAPSGNNDKPTDAEIQASLPFLKEQIDIVNPGLIVALGLTAYKTLGLLSSVQPASMKALSGKLLSWNGRYLGVLPHPSPRVVGVYKTLEEITKDLKSILKEYHNVQRT